MKRQISPGELMKESGFADYFSFDVTPYTSVTVFEEGEDILREGQKVTRLYYLAKGSAKLFMTHKNGRVTLINFYEAPCFLGEMELLDPETPSRGVRAHTRCECLVLDLARCGERVRSDGLFLRALCLYLGRKAFVGTRTYAQRQAYPLENRLAAYILMTARDGVYAEKHTEASEYLGITYRHLLYVMAKFCKQGILRRLPRGYAIENEEQLIALQDEMQA
ncbi:MAG: transcriptional regulator YeiL [Pygmaiobacter sp.]|nr:transcriptional regulator YeiL [Pygmaiobacter sp.]